MPTELTARRSIRTTASARGRGARARRVSPPRAGALLFAALMIVAGAAEVRGQDATESLAQVELCLEAERFLRGEMEMQAITEPDTIDDWRTGRMVPGCRITAAGGTTWDSRSVARHFFDVLPESGWVRTPDPRDAPNEASLRYRRAGADCLFTFYDQWSALGTDAEFAVSDAVPLEDDESLYHFLVMCTPEAPAKPRGDD